MPGHTTRILRVPVLSQNTGERNGQTIVAKSILQKDFQLELTATDSNNVFHIECKQAELIAARDKKNKASEEEWRNTIAWTMCGVRPTNDVGLTGVELEAFLKPEKQITFVISKNFGEVTQRLGTIIAPCDDEVELDLFLWAQEAVSARDDVELAARDLAREKDGLESTVEGLNERLDAFAHEKKDHEDLMLERFRQLLNTKKLKIRDQQRLLKQTKLGKASASDAAGSDEEHTVRSNRKRKASGRVKAERAEEDIEMDMPESDDSESLGRKHPQATPDRSEDEQETEDEDEDVTQDPQYRTPIDVHRQTSLSAADPEHESTQLPVQTRAWKTQAQHRDAEADDRQTDDDEEL